MGGRSGTGNGVGRVETAPRRILHPERLRHDPTCDGVATSSNTGCDGVTMRHDIVGMMSVARGRGDRAARR